MYSSLHTLTDVIHIHPQAYHLNLHYPHHTFITTGWFAPKWWLVEDPLLSCTPRQRESVLPLSFAVIQYVFIEDHNMTTDTGIVSLPLCSVALYILSCACLYFTLHTLQDNSMNRYLKLIRFAADWWAILS